MGKDTKKRTSSYRHLTIEEREEIAIGLENGDTFSSIAERLGRHRSTISREFQRNSPQQRNVRYRAHRAHLRYETRIEESHKKERLKNHTIRQYAEEKLKEGWTPELIAGRLPMDVETQKTNYESIYQWIYENRPDLIKLLPRSHRKRRKRCSAKNKHSIRITNRTMIDKRSSIINERKEYGHWEVDTVVSRQSLAAVAVLQERKSRYAKFRKLNRKSADNLSKSIVTTLKKYPKKLIKSLTYDNGTENAEHEATNAALETRSFFCRPYHSWEKGSVENCIGLLRRFYPKKTNWALLTQKDLNSIERKINTRPKKCLGFKTPEEVFVALTA